MTNKIEIMLVGGAVRDKLLGLPVNDEDYLVVHGTPEHFLNLGYEQVGKDFPVFLHPETKDEYALARTERKVGVGYNGFETSYDPSVTAEEDLFRRDLTINAIAQKSNGDLVDPFGGVNDLNNKVLRHVSNHFAEDPVRVLRIARFMSRYSELGFTIHKDTMQLMKDMVNNGELNHLTSERVLLEMDKTFSEPSPSKFFETLRECGALKVVFPEIDALFGIPQPEKYHPEIDTGIHTLMVLEQAAKLSNNNKAVMFAALVHDLGKAVTFNENLTIVNNAKEANKPIILNGAKIEPDKLLQKHFMHEVKGVSLVNQLCDRLKAPNTYRQLALISCEFHTKMHNVSSLTPPVLFELYKSIQAFKSEENIINFALVCESDAKGRTGLENNPYPQKDFLMHCFPFIKDNNSKEFIDAGFKGKELGEKITQHRINALNEAKALYPPNVATKCQDWIAFINDLNSKRPDEIMRCIKSLSVGKNTNLLNAVLTQCEGDFEQFKELATNVCNINAHAFVEQGLRNVEVGLAIKQEALRLINHFKTTSLNVTDKVIVKRNKP